MLGARSWTFTILLLVICICLLLVSGPQYVQNKKQTVHESQTTHQTYSNTSQYKRSSDNVTIYNKTTTESLHYTTRRSTITHGAADKSPAVPGVNLIDTSATVYGNSLSSKCIATRTVPWFYICLFPREKDVYISASLEASGQWETLLTGLVQRALNRYPNSLFLNLGANIGYYSLLAARMNHQVIAVEPQDQCMLRLHMGVLMNSLQNKMHLVHNALSRKAGEIVNFSHNAKDGTLNNQGGVQTRVLNLSAENSKMNQPGTYEKTTTMDHLLAITKFNESVILIDIEGSECQAFSGGQHFLDTIFVPYIFMEWSLGMRLHETGTPCSQSDTEAMVQDFTRRGFKPYKVTSLTSPLNVNDWQSWSYAIMDMVWIHEKAKPLQ